MKLIVKICHFIYDSFIFIIKVSTGSYRNAKLSFSQHGEDLIIRGIFNALNIANPTYLDIGANDPVSLNNTYLFYINGAKGVLVEPDPGLHVRLMIKRKRDKCLNIGIGPYSINDSDFYVMSSKVLNTFSKEDAMKIENYGTYKIEKTIKVPIRTVNDIIQEYFDKYPNFISLDVEGLDLEILQSIDFSKFRPEVFCLETLTYSEDKSGIKEDEIFKIMEKNRYMIYADTNLNTIFVDEKAWSNR